jgi:NitT/TauT family transport system permease protein
VTPTPHPQSSAQSFLESCSDSHGPQAGDGGEPRWRRAWDLVGLPAAGGGVLLGVWWAGTAAFGIRPFFVPKPPEVLDAFARLPGHLLRQAGHTLTETMIGFGLAAAAGMGLAVVLTSWPLLQRAMMPWVVAANAVPKVAVAPLLVVWLGFGIQPKVALVVLICFFPVVVSTMAGLTCTPTELGELARSLSASGWQTFVKVRLPWALPQIFVGLKVAISLALVGAVVGEIQTPDRGLGAVILSAGTSADTPLAFAAIALLAVLGIGLFYLVAGLERLLLPWAAEISG